MMMLIRPIQDGNNFFSFFICRSIGGEEESLLMNFNKFKMSSSVRFSQGSAHQPLGLNEPLVWSVAISRSRGDLIRDIMGREGMVNLNPFRFIYFMSLENDDENWTGLKIGQGSLKKLIVRLYCNF